MSGFNNNTIRTFLVALFSFLSPMLLGSSADVLPTATDSSVPIASVVEAVDAVAVRVVTAPYRFVEYLGDVTTILERAGDSSEQKIAFMRARIELTKQWLDRLEVAVAQGAFADFPLIIANLYRIFYEIDPVEWPTPALVRTWVNALHEYKKFLVAAYIPALATSRNRQADSDALNAIIGFYDELTRFVLTSHFFEFSLFDTAWDMFVVRPMEFTKAHPYIVAGTVVALLAAGGGWWWYSKREERAWNAWMVEENARLVRNGQNGAECAVWTMYRQVCYQQAAGDENRYAELATDEDRYERFKGVVIDIRAAQRARHGRRPVANRNALANWLEMDDVAGILNNLRQRDDAEEFRVRGNLPFIGSFEQLADVGLRDVDQEVVAGVDLEGDALMEAPHRDRIQAFNQQAGNTYDFVVNTNPIPGPRPPGRRGVPARGHFFHVRAINDPGARDGVRFIVSETSRWTSREFISGVLANIRNILRPYEDEA